MIKGASLTRSINNFLRRFHVMLFTIIVLGGLAAAIFSLYRIIDTSSQPDDSIAPSTLRNFDEPTIEAIDQLRTTDDNQFSLPPGRNNPFVE